MNKTKADIDQDPRDCVRKMGEMIKNIKIAMLTTVDPDGCLRSRPMFTQEQEFDGDLWFFTARHSGKVHSIENDQQINLAYADPSQQRYVSVVGKAQVVDDPEKARELWRPSYEAFFPKGLNDPDLALLQVRVHSAEYWETPHGPVVKLIGFAKSILGEGHAPPATNERLSLRH